MERAERNVRSAIAVTAALFAGAFAAARWAPVLGGICVVSAWIVAVRFGRDEWIKRSAFVATVGYLLWVLFTWMPAGSTKV